MGQDKTIKSKRFKEAEQIAANIQRQLGKVEEIIRSQSLFHDDSLVEYLMPYFRKKVEGKPIRAYFTWKSFEYLMHYQTGEQEVSKAQELLFSTHLPLVFELAMTIQYLHNQILDEKMDARSSNRRKVNKNLIESNLLREVLFTYVKKEIYPLLGTAKHKFLKDRLRKLMINVDMGQRLEKEYGTFDAWKRDTVSHPSTLFPKMQADRWLGDEFCRSYMAHQVDGVLEGLKVGHSFTRVYFHRIYWTNAYFFRVIAEIAIELTDAKGTPLAAALQRFAIHYGFLAQILNDCVDFVHSDDPVELARLKATGKKNTDFMSDLHNFNITLPLIFHLQEDQRGKIEAYLTGTRKARKLLEQYPKQIMHEIVRSSAILKCTALNLTLAKAATADLDTHNPATPLLVNMCEIVNDNKYLRILFQHKIQ